MAIVSVRTELLQTNVANVASNIRTDLTQTIAIWRNIGNAEGVIRESSAAVLTAPSLYFGKALAAGGDTVARAMTTARNTSPLTPLI